MEKTNKSMSQNNLNPEMCVSNNSVTGKRLGRKIKCDGLLLLFFLKIVISYIRESLAPGSVPKKPHKT